MTGEEGAGDALFDGRVAEGFTRRVLRLAPGAGLRAGCLAGAIVLVEQGVLELECRAGACRRFGRGSMIPLAGRSVVHLRNAGRGPVVLVAVSRRGPGAADEFSGCAGSHDDD